MNIYNNFANFKISAILPPQAAYKKDKTSTISFANKNLQKDVFIKTANPISFKGNEPKETTSNNENFYKSKKEARRKSRFIDIYLNKNLRAFAGISMKDAKTYPIEKLIASTVKPKLASYAASIFRNTGIKTEADLKDFAAMYNVVCSNNKNAKLYGYEMLQIYANDIDAKERLKNFGELIFHALESNESENISSDKLYKYVFKLENMGIKSEKDFKRYFAFIKNSFNDFQDTEDVIGAIDFVEKDYPENLDFTKGAMEKFDFSKYNSTPASIYLDNAELIHFIQKEYKDTPLDKRQELFKKVVDFNHLKNSVQKELKQAYHLDNIQEVLEFIKQLASKELEIQELEGLLQNKNVADIKANDIIENKGEIELEIMKTRNCSKEEATSFYLNFAFGLNSVFIKDEENTCSIGELINIIDEFNLKDDLDLIKFIGNFNNANLKPAKGKGKNKKGTVTKSTVSSSAIRKSVNLLSFRKGKTHDKAALQKSKALYESIKTQIENYIKDDENLRFSGKSAFDVFREYEEIFAINQNVQEAFQAAGLFDSANNEAALEKLENFSEFSKFFNSAESAREFAAKNIIGFDNTDENKEYRRNIITILDALYDEDNPQRTEDYINKLSNSKLLINSKTGLSNFLDLYKESDLKLLFETMLDRSVSSCADMERFLDKYANSTQKINHILSSIQALPEDITLTEYEKQIAEINSAFSGSGIPIRINSNSIANLETDGFLKFKNGDKGSLYKLAASLNKTQGNFVAGLDSAFSTDYRPVSPLGIAREIVRKDKTASSSYSNIKRELGLDNLDFPSTNKDTLWDDEFYALAIAEALDEKFVSYINSDDWYKYDDGYTKPNLSLHSKMRAVERFVLEEEGSIDKLYSKDSMQKIKDIFKALYQQTPSNVEKGNSSDEFIIYSDLPDRKIKAVFNNDGKLITIM